MEHEISKWSPDSWRQKKAAHQPVYSNSLQLQEVLEKIHSWPPLVFAGEVDQLKKELAMVAQGKRFLLQGGDCAEKFSDCNQEAITSKLKILLQMSVVLCYASRKPVVRIGRIAGQYGKPRSNPTEIINNQEMPVYRGDNINSFDPDPEARQPDPERLARGQQLSAMTLNYIRALTSGGFADLHHPDTWNLDFVAQSPHWARYDGIVADIKKAINFMETIGYQESYLSQVDFYTSHEGLILALEEALTHKAANGRYYNLGAHMLWIGDRTRQLEGAHVEYFRGVANPTGIKVGPSTDPDVLSDVIKAINPSDEEGRIMLITRFGENKVREFLPGIIEKISASGLNVCWSCDPMHGNVIKTKSNTKTRDFNAILSELRDSFEIHKNYNTCLGGVHFELTGNNVTECTGGAEGITAGDLSKNYDTFCDPRLNYSQSLEMAFLISSMLPPDSEQAAH